MMSAAELALHRSNTAAFIAADPTTVTLTPRQRVKTGSGVTYLSLPPRPPQTFKLVDQSAASGPVPGSLQGADGIQRQVQYQLVGLWDAQVGMYDVFADANGISWEVAELLPDNGYERRAMVIRYGES